MSIFPERWQGRLIPTHNIPKFYIKGEKTYETKTNKEFKSKNKMNLKEQFENVEIMFENQTCKLKYDELYEAPNECVKIADEFAINFADWIYNKRKYNSFKMDMMTKGYLAEYKKEKGL